MNIELKAFAIATILLIGCVTVSEPENQKNEISTLTTYIGDIFVVEDTTRNITCWVYEAPMRGGISCIPNSQLKEELKT